MELPEIRNPFTGGKLVGTSIDSRAYHRQASEEIVRGHPQFVMSRSELMLFDSCPARWIAGYEPKETDATEWGTLMDCVVTDKERFEQKFALQPETCKATKSMQAVRDGEAWVGDDVPWSGTAKECKEWTAAARKDGKIVVKSDEMKDCKDAQAKLLADPIVNLFLKSCDFQVMAFADYWDKEAALAVPVKVLIDLAPHPESEFHYALGDFKTARSADPEAWRQVVDQRNYDAQAAMCLDVYNIATGEARDTFHHVIQENVFPWQVARRLITSTFITIGRLKVLGALKRYAKCLKDNRWPSWNDGENTFKGWGGCEPKEWTIARWIGQI